MLVGPAKTLLFVSPRFLLPLDSGGRIRTCQILKGLKSLKKYRVVLLSPASESELSRFEGAMLEYCDEFVSWKVRGGLVEKWRRVIGMLSRLPMPVYVDQSDDASCKIRAALDEAPDVVVFDFMHGSVLCPQSCTTPSVLFTHNVEAEIFERHLKVSRGPLFKLVWRDQLRKMLRFEGRQLRRFDVTVAVSQRDSDQFANRYGVEGCHVIPTGVDISHYGYLEPGTQPVVAFCGSMDWLANQDGVEWMLDSVWPRVVEQLPAAEMRIIGRSPPQRLIEKARMFDGWTFTGFVDDVREHLAGAAASVIPLRIGGGTRMKAFESMALGVPVVSTSVGVEGLDLVADEHFLQADDAVAFGDAIVRMLTDADLRGGVSARAREFVEENASHINAARVFQEACEAAERC